MMIDIIHYLKSCFGGRVGELLALTKSDIDFQNNQIHISKTYYRMNGEDVITTPKTEQSIRTVDIPEFLKNEIKDYVSRIYECKDHQRLFPMVLEAVQHKMKRNIEKAGVKKIRVHDLRHSHVAYLIHQGVQPLIIKGNKPHMIFDYALLLSESGRGTSISFSPSCISGLSPSGLFPSGSGSFGTSVSTTVMS